MWEEKVEAKEAKALHHHNTIWGHDEVTALINYKQKEQITLKQVINPHTNMILAI